MFRHDLDVIESLRRDAVNVREAHSSGIAKLQTYAGQLVWMSGKFPIDIGADFTWYPALGYHTEHPLVQNNLKYELMNVLFNLAALYSQLAMASNRGTTEGLKTAASYFSQAAGVLSHMKNQVLPELRMASPPDDMDEATLESLTQLLLAQSQETFWQKAVMDGYKDASIAKLAARVSDLYNLAGEAAMRSEAISSAWIHHMSAKHHHFAAAAQYRAACDCLEKRRYGEEVARLTDAVACVNEGLKEARGGYLNKAVVEDLHGLKKRVEEDLKRAEKDNDIIYLRMFLWCRTSFMFTPADTRRTRPAKTRAQDPRAGQHGRCPYSSPGRTALRLLWGPRRVRTGPLHQARPLRRPSRRVHIRRAPRPPC